MEEYVKKLLAALALSALVAGPATAAKKPTEAQKEKSDKAHKNQDDKVAKGDEAKARELFKRAAELEKKAHEEWVAAGKFWEQRELALHRMHTEQANARAMRHAAIRLNSAAHRLFLAENDRAAALSDRLAADQLLKNAHAHLANAGAAKTAIAEGKKAEAELKGNPQFADAVKAIEADIKRNETREEKEEAAAKADSDAANGLLSAASRKENEANALEKAVLPQPAILVKAPPAPKPIVVKAPGK